MANGTKWTKWTPKRKAAFLEGLIATGNVSEAVRLSAMSRSRVYELRDKDDDFRVAWEEAVEIGIDNLEQAARDRALNGVDEPVFYLGAVCGHKRKYSDTLTIFLLKGARPEKYRDRHEITGADGAPLMAGVLAVPAGDSAAWDKIAKQQQDSLKTDVT